MHFKVSLIVQMVEKLELMRSGIPRLASESPQLLDGDSGMNVSSDSSVSVQQHI